MAAQLQKGRFIGRLIREDFGINNASFEIGVSASGSADPTLKKRFGGLISGKNSGTKKGRSTNAISPNGLLSDDGNPILDPVRRFLRNPIVQRFGIQAGISLIVGIGYLCAKLFKVPIIGSILQDLWGKVTSALQFVWTFNWNATDKDLDELIKGKTNSLYGLLGGVAGSAVGFVVCGAIPGALAFAFNPTLGAAILKNVAEEAKDEVYGQLASLANATTSTLANALTVRAFKGARRWLKRPNSPFYKILKTALGPNFDKWGESNLPSFTFAQATEDAVESIEDPRLRNFTEEFLEEAWDSCLHAGYIVQDTSLSYMAAMRLMQDEGETQTVTVEFGSSS